MSSSEVSNITLNFTDVSPLNNTECSSEGLRYLAGYIAFRCRDVDESLGSSAGKKM